MYPSKAGHLEPWTITLTPLVQLLSGAVVGQSTVGRKLGDGGVTLLLHAAVECMVQAGDILHDMRGLGSAHVAEAIHADAPEHVADEGLGGLEFHALQLHIVVPNVVGVGLLPLESEARNEGADGRLDALPFGEQVGCGIEHGCEDSGHVAGVQSVPFFAPVLQLGEVALQATLWFNIEDFLPIFRHLGRWICLEWEARLLG